MSKKKNKKGGDAWWIGTIIGVIIGIATDHLAGDRFKFCVNSKN